MLCQVTWTATSPVPVSVLVMLVAVLSLAMSKPRRLSCTCCELGPSAGVVPGVMEETAGGVFVTVLRVEV